MQRNLVSNAGGDTFFEKFRNGIGTILAEVDKLEYIISDLDNKEGQSQDTTYYSDAIDLLDSSNIIHVCIWYILSIIFPIIRFRTTEDLRF